MITVATNDRARYFARDISSRAGITNLNKARAVATITVHYISVIAAHQIVVGTGVESTQVKITLREPTRGVHDEAAVSADHHHKINSRDIGTYRAIVEFYVRRQIHIPSSFNTASRVASVEASSIVIVTIFETYHVISITTDRLAFIRARQIATGTYPPRLYLALTATTVSVDRVIVIATNEWHAS